MRGILSMSRISLCKKGSCSRSVPFLEIKEHVFKVLLPANAMRGILSMSRISLEARLYLIYQGIFMNTLQIDITLKRVYM